jgi:glycosyltransferase involved in cell wall biosynthesis
MNICLVTDAFFPTIGGVATFYKHLCEILVHEGHKIILIITGETKSKENELELVGDSIIKVYPGREYNTLYKKYQPYFRPGGHDAPHWLAMGMSARNWLIANLKKYGIDIIEVSDYGGLGIFMLHEALPPYVVTANSSLLQLHSYSNFSVTDHIAILKRLERLSFNYAASIIAHSTINQTSLKDIVNKPIEFVDAPWKGIALPMEERDGGLPIVVGGLQAIKGSIFLAETLNEIQKTEHAFQIKWIGYDTYTAPSKKLMSLYLQRNFSLVWQKNFLWIDEKTNEETMAELASASFIVIPSIWETFNYVSLEAAALGKAIIITDGTGASSYFTHGVNALIVKSGNHQEMKDAILLLYNNPALATKLGTAAKAIFTKHFFPKDNVHARIEIYKSCIYKATNNSQNEFNEKMSFLKNYLTSNRRGYYAVRAFLKKILKPNASF